MALLEVDAIQLRGKSERTRVYTLLGDEAVAASEPFKTLHAAHQRLLDAMTAGDALATREEIATCKRLAEPFAISPLYDVFAERLIEKAAE